VRPDLVQRMLTGDRAALARLFTLIERRPDEVPALMQAVHERTGRAYTVGITGPPGAGKSTLTDSLIEGARKDGQTVGVIAVDPSSPFGGGALLGDRVRMSRHYLDDRVFIRSLATHGAHGGLSRATRAGLRLLDAFGAGLIVVESVGVGQTDLDIRNVADTVVVVLVPEAGDAIQALKAGIMEIADIYVVNKADREGAGQLAAAIKAETRLGRAPGWWTPPIILTQAHTGQGVQELRDAVEEHRRESERTGNLARRRESRSVQEFKDALRDAIEARLTEITAGAVGGAMGLDEIASGAVDPYSAARAAMERWARGLTQLDSE